MCSSKYCRLLDSWVVSVLSIQTSGFQIIAMAEIGFGIYVPPLLYSP